MKKIAAILTGLLATSSISYASDTIELDAGVLRTSAGAPLTSGLLQLIAVRTPNGVFANPTPSSFIGGDSSNELVISSFSFSQGTAGFVTGESDNVITYSYENTTRQFSATTFDPGDALLLRWYPTLTLSSTSPGIGTTYGQYRSDGTPDGGIAWFGPDNNRTIALPNGLNFLTTSASGSNPDTAGLASNVVIGVPEPSSYVLIGGMCVCVLGLARIRRDRI